MTREQALAQLLREWMKNNKLTIMETAEMLDVSPRAVDNWLRGEKTLRPNSWKRLEAIVGRRVYEIRIGDYDDECVV